jgi:hypothetical protein
MADVPEQHRGCPNSEITPTKGVNPAPPSQTEAKSSVVPAALPCMHQRLR